MDRRSRTCAIKIFTAITVMLVSVSAGVIVNMQLSRAAAGELPIAPVLHEQTLQRGDTADNRTQQLAEDNEYQQKQVPVTSELTETAKTGHADLKLLLLGSISGDPSVARALIKDLESNTLRIYKTSQQIRGGYIDKIEKNRVFVFHEGCRHELNLAVIHHGPEKVHITGGDNQNQTSAVEQPQNPSTVSSSVTATAGRWSLQKPLESLELVLRGAKVELCRLQNEVLGLKVVGLENIPVTSEMDLRNGDVIHRVNGHLLVNKQQAWQVFEKTRAEDIVDIEVLCSD